MTWQSSFTGSEITKHDDGLHYSIYWHYARNSLHIEAVNVFAGRMLYNRPFVESDLNQFPDLKDNQDFINFWYKQIANAI